MNYVAPWWLPGGHAQTIWPALWPQTHPNYQRERWATPDHDFVDVDRLAPPNAQTLVVLFHGLEGSSGSHYALAFASMTQREGHGFAVPHFRGCSGHINLAPRAYHSGDYEEVGWILARLRATHPGRLLVVGVSLGGNAVLRWAQEMGAQAARVVDAVVSISAPIDLAASGQAIGRGFNKLVYTRRFLATMKPKALQKLAQHPCLFSAADLAAADSLYAFDNVFTAPLHGFKNTHDYWQRASAKPHLADICIPALVINAHNDPFVPADSLPHNPASDQTVQQLSPWVTLWQPLQGGHVGFVHGKPPGNTQTLPTVINHWFQTHTTNG
jgi:predicted alpha/beta-fold hydrolase